jgi:xanthine dehydrogenase YagR molybdenum-binding subunit
MKFDKPATDNPIDRLKVIGQPHDRIDGARKVTGAARYAYEQHDVVPDQAYGYVLGAGIAKGRSPPSSLTPRARRRVSSLW